MAIEIWLCIRIDEARTPQAGRAWIWERSWERVRPAKRAAVRMKSCMVFVYVRIELRSVCRWLVRCDN